MITMSHVYWLTRCSDIKAALGVGGPFVLTCLILCVGMIACVLLRDVADSDSERKAFKKAFKWIGVALAVVLLRGAVGSAIAPFVPTTRDAAAIVVIPKIANSESVQGLGEEVVGLAREWVQEMKPKTKPAEAKPGA